jgi:Tol biopolymer transport system component
MIPDATTQWAWAPRGARLVFVTKDGGVSVAEPGGKPSAILAPSAGRASHPAWSPDGSRVAVALPDRIVVVDLDSLEPTAVFTTSGPAPEVAGWTPDSKYVLFWAKPLGADGKVAGRALDAVPAAGGDWQNVWDSMLPFRDFVTRCGREIAIAGGGRQLVSEGKQILLTGPPQWEFHNVTNDYVRSWVWPVCSPNRKLLAVTSMSNREESKFSGSPRVLWVIRLDNTSKRTRIDPPDPGAFESPRWSRDGRTILVVQRSENDWDAPGSLVLVEVNPTTGETVQVADLQIDVGRAPGEGGHQRWTETTDWYQPRAPTPSPSPSETTAVPG